ncbi:tRNA (guanosine(37)-N1)-methyltransferase TrmD [Paramaledivibacter caminithermalis]|jgi:tRNA (guanine37-N1)-methyltransferase|uniref:tRNA (guanine-N(1)-)-methyltransferase n=1 Tax=Paramaledivibacter caminithermalis (strain DSM 15212 / CIP 107654 / DViRD3) TaxID=1121301 RepID=A0A1M6NJM9_PARC5|nr:tRNA (guanosine(37)-N1)-methyltransferase TrmD [Paramaledivibacter caminithermalis]SHJ95968.1 tRNA (guanine37-N1)-methyltransferase [Paramaledivibacter caminithermalis DSM 15212]
MIIDILTLFPQMFTAIMNESIVGRAQEKGIIEINPINIRDFSKDKHKRVDDYPYGGGSGMVLMNQPLFDAMELLTRDKENSKIIYLTPKGKTFNQEIAKSLSLEKNLIFICGHYEGIDQRFIDEWVTDEISIGDYVLTGGELPAMVLIDSIVRLVPGVLNKNESFIDESFYSGLLEYPHYTRPKDYKGHCVPEILLSGNHKLINEWRTKESIKITIERRPDLIAKLFQRDDIDIKGKSKLRKYIEEISNEKKKNF